MFLCKKTTEDASDLVLSWVKKNNSLFFLYEQHALHLTKNNEKTEIATFYFLLKSAIQPTSHKKTPDKKNAPSKKTEPEHAAVVGLGYVGLPLACLIKKRTGYVIGIDVDSKKISAISHHQSPFRDAALSRFLSHVKEFDVTTHFRKIEDVNVVVICVPTPITENHTPDLYPLRAACRAIAPHLKSGTLVVVESSIYPGTTETVIQPILEEGSGLSVQKNELFLAHCPERVNPGDPLWRVENLPRVIGGVNEESTKRAAAFYRKLLPGIQVKEMYSVAEAEAVKMVENAFRDVNIAFVNELAMAFEKFHINILHVIEGASTKPFAFLPHYPGCGVGGHCIPVDPYYLISQAKEHHVPLRLLSMARWVNNHMPDHTVQLTYDLMRRLELDESKATVAVLGLAYKANTDDERESPSHDIIKLLEMQHTRTIVYDPYLSHRLSVSSLKEALSQTDIVILATAHQSLLDALTPAQLSKYHVRGVVDGRNSLSKEGIEEAQIAYVGIGR